MLMVWFVYWCDVWMLCCCCVVIGCSVVNFYVGLVEIMIMLLLLMIIVVMFGVCYVDLSGLMLIFMVVMLIGMLLLCIVFVK